MGLLNKFVVFSAAFFPLLAAGGDFVGGGNGSFIGTPPGGISIANGSLVGGNGGTAPASGVITVSGGTYSAPPGGWGVGVNHSDVTISGGTYLAPPGGWGVVINDADVTLSGGTFSSVCFQYETNGTVAATIASDAKIETGDGVWLGYYGSGSSLAVESNATLRGDALVVGYDPVASSNRVVVSGSNARLLARNGLYLGGHYEGANWVDGGTGNRIEVSGGGSVSADALRIQPGNRFDLDSGGTLAIRGDFSAATPGFSFNPGGTLELGGELVGQYTRIEAGRTIVFNGMNARWFQPYNHIKVGEFSSGNTLKMINGGKVDGALAVVGEGVQAHSNLVEMSGSSRWDTQNDFVVGGSGDGNRVDILRGAKVQVGIYSGRHVYIGENDGSDGNGITVSGMRATLECGGDVQVGYKGDGNRLLVENGGSVSCEDIYVGEIGVSSGNVAIVSGAGSELVSSGYGFVGNYGSDNRFEVRGGGAVVSPIAYVGTYSGSDRNSLLISGGDSSWSGDVLVVGYAGASNALEVFDGGLLSGSNLFVGAYADNNTATVSGEGSRIVNIADTSVGYGSDNNALTIENGGRILSKNGFVGSQEGADSNTVLVIGAGTLWHLSDGLAIGCDGSETDWVDGGTGNSLTVSNGGWVQVGDVGTNNLPDAGNFGVVSVGGINGAEMVVANGSRVQSDIGYVGLEANMKGSVTVMGESVWENTGDLSVGYAGSGNMLRIENGAHIFSGAGFVGRNASANSNSVVLSGVGSVWDNSGDLYVGSNGSGNTVQIEAGAQVMNKNSSVGVNGSSNRVSVIGEGSVWHSKGRVIVGQHGSGNILRIEEGARLESLDGFVGVEKSANGNRVVVSNAGSVWFNRGPQILLEDATQVEPVRATRFSEWYLPPLYRSPKSFRDLVIGISGSRNVLEIKDGGQVVNFHGIIGEKSNAWNNAVSVIGNNSTWSNDGDLYLGGRISELSTLIYGEWFAPWIDGGQGNSLYVADGGLVSVGRDMHNRNHSTVSVDPGGHIAISSNYYQDATSVLRFGVETNAVGAPLNPFVSVGGTAEFEMGATLEYHSNVGLLDFDTSYTNLIVEANQLIVGGVTNANALDLEAINLDGSLVDVMLWEQDQDIYGLVGRRHLADSAGFDPNSQMAGVSKGIDDLSLMGDPLAVEQVNRLNGMSSAQQSAQLTQRYSQSAPTYRHRQSMQGGQRQVLAQGRAFQSGRRAAKPEGAAGPHQAEQGLRGWVRGYGSVAEHDGSSSFSGFDQNVYGTVVGLDKAFGSVLLGAAGGYSGSNLEQDDNDTSDAKTGFGVLYASLGTTDWFGDLNLGYGRSAVTTRSGTALGGSGDFDADLYSVYFGGGKEIRLSDGGLLLTPSAAMNIGYYAQESYNDGLMEIDSYDRWSYQSRLGAALALVKRTEAALLKPEIRAYWLHEFNADPDRLGYTLGGGRYAFGVQAPDEDILEAGAGISATLNGRLELVLDLDGQLGENYSALALGARAVLTF